MKKQLIIPNGFVKYIAMKSNRLVSKEQYQNLQKRIRRAVKASFDLEVVFTPDEYEEKFFSEENGVLSKKWNCGTEYDDMYKHYRDEIIDSVFTQANYNQFHVLTILQHATDDWEKSKNKQFNNNEGRTPDM